MVQICCTAAVMPTSYRLRNMNPANCRSVVTCAWQEMHASHRCSAQCIVAGAHDGDGQLAVHVVGDDHIQAAVWV